MPATSLPDARSPARLRLAHGERFNALSHFGGLLLAVVAAIALLVEAIATSDAARIVGAGAFGLSAVGLYLASTLYHASQGRAKQAWRTLDHCAIYAMIAGTYTPFALVALGGLWGWLLSGVVWAAALVGMRSEWRPSGDGAPSLWRYLAFGWLAVMAAAPLVLNLRGAALAWLLAGAACYTLGTLFYRNRRGWRHAHGAWHLFVLAGSACHAVTIGCFVL